MAAASSAVNQRQEVNKQLAREESIRDTNFQRLFDELSEQECQKKFSFEKSGLRKLPLYFNWIRGHTLLATATKCLFSQCCVWF